MGLLDEAIREHLELKRRRGADPAEIARQEREALGPGRQPASDVAVAPEEPVVAEAPAAAEWEEPAEPAVAEPAFDEEADDGGDHAGWDDVDEDVADVEDVAEPATRVMEAPAPPPPAPAPPAPPASAGEQGQQTSEYDVLAEEEGRSAEPASYRAQEHDEGESDDVLEETPEFLQETPEHDRLWFEQRPPRDFDFDG